MEGQQCKICFKSFSNGKALGGHMRSHYATLPLPPKTPQRQELGGNTESTTCSLFSVLEDVDEKLPKSLRVVDPEFLDDAGSVVIQDKLTEPESTRKRYRGWGSSKEVIKKRNTGSSTESLAELKMESRRSRGSEEEEEEEEGAWSLIMLSRDGWSSNDSVESRLCQLSEKKYQCETCEKIFKSSQGLGSHRTSHKTR